MDAQKLQIKLYAAPKNGVPFAIDAVVPVFHDWIRRKVLPELMIDIASYEHVPQGPGILFVGHGSDYYLDEGKGKLGLLYSRKREAPAPADRLSDSFRRAVHVAHLLEQEKSLALRFRTDEILFRINDRLGAPNTDATFVALKPELDAFFGKIFGGAAFTLARTGEPRELFAVTCKITNAAGAPNLATLLKNVGGPPS